MTYGPKDKPCPKCKATRWREGDAGLFCALCGCDYPVAIVRSAILKQLDDIGDRIGSGEISELCPDGQEEDHESAARSPEENDGWATPQGPLYARHPGNPELVIYEVVPDGNGRSEHVADERNEAGLMRPCLWRLLLSANADRFRTALREAAADRGLGTDTEFYESARDGVWAAVIRTGGVCVAMETVVSDFVVRALADDISAFAENLADAGRRAVAKPPT